MRVGCEVAIFYNNRCLLETEWYIVIHEHVQKYSIYLCTLTWMIKYYCYELMRWDVKLLFFYNNRCLLETEW